MRRNFFKPALPVESSAIPQLRPLNLGHPLREIRFGQGNGVKTTSNRVSILKMPRPETHSPIQEAVQQWLTRWQLGSSDNGLDELLKTAPKRFTVYDPMVLLPSGSFNSPEWTTLLSTCDEDVKASFWRLILEEISKVGKAEVKPLTNLAINQGIPLHKDGIDEENVLRSPTGLQILYGDFGSARTTEEQPTAQEFDEAFWVTTKQNQIHQTWAPRWTMFSRGNVKEKARLLQFEKAAKSGPTTWAIDLYGGIGYFVFSYARLGMKVACWELNPWSVEGLHRGALANKWKVKVIRGDDLDLPIEQLMDGDQTITVFQEDNQKALGRIQQMQQLQIARDIRHVNCGFLPTSEPTWRATWEMTRHSSTSHLHLHENVGVNDIKTRQSAIQDMYVEWSRTDKDSRIPVANHVEQVKTYAPGVWHCVFDVYINNNG